jgi:hypothetical protein
MTEPCEEVGELSILFPPWFSCSGARVRRRDQAQARQAQRRAQKRRARRRAQKRRARRRVARRRARRRALWQWVRWYRRTEAAGAAAGAAGGRGSFVTFNVLAEWPELSTFSFEAIYPSACAFTSKVLNNSGRTFKQPPPYMHNAQ